MSKINKLNKQIDYVLEIRGNGEIHPIFDKQVHKPYEFNQEKLKDINHHLGWLDEKRFKGRKDFEYFGGLLFEALFIKRSFNETIWLPLQSDTTLRLRLVFEKSIKQPTDFIEKVINLPWEFLYYPDGKTFLGTDPRITLSCEYQNWTTKQGYAINELPLRILFVYAQSNDLEKVGFSDLVRDKLLEFKNTLDDDKVTLKELQNPSIKELRDVFLQHKPHVFHFLGHGTSGKLVLKDVKDGTPLFYGGESLADLVRGANIKLVVLQACEGGAPLSDSSFSGTAAWLVQQGIPAVVAMRYPIYQTLAWRFIQEFYTTLINEQFSVDRAVQMGRNELSSIVEHAKRYFGAPVLW
ncbi:MAG: CHAT domain-containing protein, partial [Candidatus Parabeggiatoa sp.]|nr:CHAT domain-containing protein [Candidatus Parabeggiatoa sp.]